MRHGIGICANALVSLVVLQFMLLLGLGALAWVLGLAFGVGLMCQVFMLNSVLRATR